jgi:hypothetical protein
MTWTQLLANRDVQPHETSKRELDEMRALIARDLADAQVEGVSADRRFATAYNAALQSATMAIACAGYRVTAKTGHHKVTVDAIILALGAAAGPYADYLETCRRKRNMIDYTLRRRTHPAFCCPRFLPQRNAEGMKKASASPCVLCG